jgi:hypothetical protein
MKAEYFIDAVGQAAVDPEAIFGVIEPFHHLPKFGSAEALFVTFEEPQEFGNPAGGLKAAFSLLYILLQGLDFGFDPLGDLVQDVAVRKRGVMRITSSRIL